ncbi:MAG: glycoside hydrolase family 1 protein [Candidatus Omnitrophica bacterium]|nr:glycoside hydrolase family 1 protein [Candidatus Omnitrophota bacterium]MDD4013931.1 glycoside hydrolase family 1 protein [Candidatus Omnitrophota bacterium]
MTYEFPKDFLWGAAASSHQIEGYNKWNDWWKCEEAGLLSERSGRACAHYGLYKNDFQLAKELGHNAHRLSLEWSRLEKTEGSWDGPEWQHYRDVVKTLSDLGIEPIVTLNHFTMPLWFAEKGGWKNKDAPRIFARFAVKALEELGEIVKYWIPINEPYILAFLGHLYGKWPPFEKDLASTLLVMRNLIKAHSLAYKDMRYHRISGTVKRPIIGIAHAVTAFHPCRARSIADMAASHLRNSFYNHSFAASAIKGRLLLPFIRNEQLAAKGTVDFVGLNYYFRQFIRYSHPFPKKIYPLGDVCDLKHHKDSGPITDMGWEIYPKGLYEVVRNFDRYKLPLMITENGIGTLDDSLRTTYIKEHLLWLARAVQDGSNVIGYLHWSLMDNYEWADGYSKRFGLVGIDYPTLKRTIRSSAEYYRSVIRSGLIQD